MYILYYMLNVKKDKWGTKQNTVKYSYLRQMSQIYNITIQYTNLRHFL